MHNKTPSSNEYSPTSENNSFDIQRVEPQEISARCNGYLKPCNVKFSTFSVYAINERYGYKSLFFTLYVPGTAISTSFHLSIIIPRILSCIMLCIICKLLSACSSLPPVTQTKHIVY